MDRVNIMRESWDYLIILDACRYDYLERCYLNFFQGELSKKMSNGSCTSEWLNNSFPDYYDDVIYITANISECVYSRKSLSNVFLINLCHLDIIIPIL